MRVPKSHTKSISLDAVESEYISTESREPRKEKVCFYVNLQSNLKPKIIVFFFFDALPILGYQSCFLCGARQAQPMLSNRTQLLTHTDAFHTLLCPSFHLPFLGWLILCVILAGPSAQGFSQAWFWMFLWGSLWVRLSFKPVNLEENRSPFIMWVGLCNVGGPQPISWRSEYSKRLISLQQEEILHCDSLPTWTAISALPWDSCLLAHPPDFGLTRLHNCVS